MKEKPWRRNKCVDCGNSCCGERCRSCATKYEFKVNPNYGGKGKKRAFSETHKENIKRAAKNRIEKYPNPMQGKRHSEESKRKMSKNSKGKGLWSEERKKDWSELMSTSANPFYDKTHSREIVDRIMRRRRKIFEKHGKQFIPNFNPKACKAIDEYGKEHGFNFQHALNGGEFYIEGLGYWVDGYDKEKNVVVEYYEKGHKATMRQDKERMHKIEEHMNCKFIVIWEDD